MTDKQKKLNRSKKGFTLMEMLLAVVIITILLAVSYIGANGLVSKIRQTKFDNIAQSMYVSAQNRIKELRATGEIGKLIAEKDNTQKGVHEVPEMPSDWAADTALADGLRYIYHDSVNGTGTSQEIIDVLLPEGSVSGDVLDDNWVIEFDPVNGYVYSAFYSEKRSATEYYENTYSIDLGDGTVQSTLRNEQRKQLPLQKKVGYYGGAADVSSQISVESVICYIEPSNADILWADLIAEIPTQHISSKLTFKVTLEGKTSGKKVTYVPFEVQGAGLRRKSRLILDKLSDNADDPHSELSFNSQFCDTTWPSYIDGAKSEPLIPGEDVEIKLEVVSDKPELSKGESSFTVNSLFSKFNSDKSKVELSYPRHLQNLDLGTSGYDVTKLSSAGLSSLSGAIQTAEIDFNKISEKPNVEDYETWASVYPGRKFKPIYNIGVKTLSGKYVDQNNEYLTKILNMHIGSSSTDAGLFGVFYGEKISYVTLVNAKIDGGANVGSFAGKIISPVSNSITAEIEGCSSYLDTDFKNDDPDKADYRENVYIKGSGSIGGLVGHIERYNTLIIKESFASSVIEGSGDIGGLVGSGYVADIRSSYADSYILVSASNSKVGGLAGKVHQYSKVEGSYAAGYCFLNSGVDSIAELAGISPSTVSNIKNSYAVFDIDGAEATSEFSTVSEVRYGWDKVYYLQAGNEPNNQKVGELYEFADRDAAVAQLSGTYFSLEAEAKRTSAYELDGVTREDYKYPSIKGLPHYGDWTEKKDTEGIIVYYENYTTTGSNREWGFSGDGITETLKKKGEPYADKLVLNGYAVMYSKGADVKPISININGEEQQLKVQPASVNYDGKERDVYVLDATWTKLSTQGKLYNKIIITDKKGSKTFYYNPHFAAVVSKGKTEPTLEGKDTINVRIRSARQLYLLSKYYNEYYDRYAGDASNPDNMNGNTSNKLAKFRFRQELNIDYSSYMWKEAGWYDNTEFIDDRGVMERQTPIGGIYKQGNTAKSKPFIASYDGGYNEINSLSIADRDNLKASVNAGYKTMGLFGYLKNIASEPESGNVSNVFFASKVFPGKYEKKYNIIGPEIDGNETAYIGMLAGLSSAKITNCAVAGHDIDCRIYNGATLYAGGLAGKNIGNIERCSVSVPEIDCRATGSSLYVGGFTGNNEGRISKSYALSHISAESKKGKVRGKAYIGGFAASNNGSVRRSYCATSTTLTGVLASNVYDFSPRADRTCYFLSNGNYNYNKVTYAYENRQNGGTALNDAELYNRSIESFSNVNSEGDTKKATESKFSVTGLETHQYNNKVIYPYPAVVKNSSGADGKYIHYGEWPYYADYGDAGFFYWEEETGGSNPGYHIYLKGINKQSADTTVKTHNNGGKISQYGYGYYTRKNFNGVAKEWRRIETGRANLTAATEFEKQLVGYDFFCFTTCDANNSSVGTGYSTDEYMHLTTAGSEPDYNLKQNGELKLTVTGGKTPGTYRYSFSPFFANAIKFDGETDSNSSFKYNAGSEKNQYHIRSIEQLQFLNWNSGSKNNVQIVTENNYKDFTYLHATKKTGTGKQNMADYESARTAQNFVQSHDLECEGKTGYTPIAAMGSTSGTNSYDAVLYSWFGGSYDGQSYVINDVAIDSGCYGVGLFSVTAGAEIKNVIMYSEHNTEIARSADKSLEGAYSIGGLISVAYDYNDGKKSINNCAIAGYKLIDRSNKKLTPGESNVGGLIGAAKVNIYDCSSVVDILIDIDYNGKTPWGNYLRVGGLIGANADTVKNCYTGGSISISERADRNHPTGTNSNAPYDNTHIYVAGIGGSGFSCNFKNFSGQTGLIDGNPKYYNCYTYMQLPKLTSYPSGSTGDGNIRGIFIIGGAADRYDSANVNLVINNCYYLDKIVKNAMPDWSGYDSGRKKFAAGDSSILIGETYGSYGTENSYLGTAASTYFSAMLYGDSEYDAQVLYNRQKRHRLSVDLTSLTYEEMRDKLINGGTISSGKIIRGLNRNQNQNQFKADFSPVTTEEGELKVDGKYSFPCGLAEIEGKNYPFASIVTQKDELSSDIYRVHYGEWPIMEGVSLDRYSVDMDLFGKIDDGSGGFVWEDSSSVLVKRYNSESEHISFGGAAPTFTIDESSVADCSLTPEYVDGKLCYRLNVNAKTTGNAVISIEYSDGPKTYTENLTVTVTADVSLSAKGLNAALAELEEGQDSSTAYPGRWLNWKLMLKDRNGNPLENGMTDDAVWVAVSADSNIFNNVSVYENGGDRLLKALANSKGETVIDVTVSNLKSHSYATNGFELDGLNLLLDVVCDDAVFEVVLKNADGSGLGSIWVNSGKFYKENTLNTIITDIPYSLGAGSLTRLIGFKIDGSEKYLSNKYRLINERAGEIQSNISATTDLEPRAEIVLKWNNETKAEFLVSNKDDSLGDAYAPIGQLSSSRYTLIGFEFAGWYDSKTGGNRILDVDGKVVSDNIAGKINGGHFDLAPDSELVLYGRWKKSTYVIREYDSTGGSWIQVADDYLIAYYNNANPDNLKFIGDAGDSFGLGYWEYTEQFEETNRTALSAYDNNDNEVLYIEELGNEYKWDSVTDSYFRSGLGGNRYLSLRYNSNPWKISRPRITRNYNTHGSVRYNKNKKVMYVLFNDGSCSYLYYDTYRSRLAVDNINNHNPAEGNIRLYKYAEEEVYRYD